MAKRDKLNSENALLRSQRDRLRKAIEPFAKFGKDYTDGRAVADDHRISMSWQFEPFRHARAAYEETGEKIE